MRISLVCIGKTDRREIKELISYYVQRLPKHFNFELLELPDVKNAKNLSAIQIKEEEAKLFSEQLKGGETVLLLDENGKQMTSREFAEKIEHWMGVSTKHLVFLVGGAYGFSQDIYARYPTKISLSKMTFTHQMVRLFMVEQIYRAATILAGKPYHND